VLDLPLVEAFLAQIELAESKHAVFQGFAAVALLLRFVVIAFHAGSCWLFLPRIDELRETIRPLRSFPVTDGEWVMVERFAVSPCFPTESECAPFVILQVVNVGAYHRSLVVSHPHT
jgi:hypothetical protein